MIRADQKPDDEIYSEEETIARREAAIQRLLKTPHKPHKDTKVGKPKAKP